MQQKIPIENLYYLLCYAWGVSDQLDKVKVDGEKCHSLENLLSMVLLNACDRLLRQGLLRAYRFEEQEVEGVRGKLNLAETLKSGKQLKGRTICQVDELTQDVVINRVIFSTLKRLMRIEGIDEDIRARLRKTLAKFPHIEEIRVTEGLLGLLLQHRLSGFYKLVLNICRLIWDSTLPCKDKDGRLEFLDFTEDDFRMNCIFERFLMNFCKQNCRDEYPEVHREYIDFQLSPFGMMFKEAGEALPMMETDVTLFNPNRQEKLILDAKFYREALVSKYGGREKVRRDHLSQILSYVMNQEDRSKPHTLNACGERGGVLVSAAISTKEKEVLREAMNRGYRIVLLRENGFPRLYKPCGESFYACSEGLLLQISPWDYHMEKKTITREQCLELNEMAERIAEWR